LRDLHAGAVEHQRSKAKAGLRRYEPILVKRLASGDDVVPHAVAPRIVQVVPETEDELLFRWTRLHWSIPTSAGYGRRLRFLVEDASNGKLIGLIGLADPVFALRPRDEWVGWDRHVRKEQLHQVMDAFVLGAVPPYSSLLFGKFVASLVASPEVGTAFDERYRGRRAVISGTVHDSPLALVTTASALGRSSVYNRLSHVGRPTAISVGFTRGSGDFQFANGLYDALSAYADLHCEATAKQAAWGSGFRNRREVVKKALGHLGLGEALVYHGIQREVFVFPRGTNAREALLGQEPLEPFDDSVANFFAAFRDRWMLPRCVRSPGYRSFDPASWYLWR
jgi:hypothetical protein